MVIPVIFYYNCNDIATHQIIIRKSVQILGVILFIIFINELPRASDKALTVLFAEVIIFAILWNNLSDEFKSIENRNVFFNSIKSNYPNFAAQLSDTINCTSSFL